jgi:transcriptional regulator with XRE-family HTH domain
MRAIKRLRLLLDIGQQELAEASGLSTRELARIEAGEQVPRRDTAQGVDAGFDSILRARLEGDNNGKEQERPGSD